MHENLASPWMHFESGMVSRMAKGRVFTYFLGTDAGKVQDPLKQIQVTVSTESDTKRLALKLADLSQVAKSEVGVRLASAWEGLATAIREVATPRMDDIYPGFPHLFERKTFDERLGGLRRPDLAEARRGRPRHQSGPRRPSRGGPWWR